MHPKVGRPLVTIASATTLVLALSGPARADAPADLTLSTLTCAPANGQTARPGDDVTCKLTAYLLAGYGYHTTADVTVPAATTYDPADPANAQGAPVPAVGPTSIHYDEQQLGLMNAGYPKQVQFRLHIRDDGGAVAGDLIQPSPRCT
jgi:hypothetical protein